jgi:hypothetical protein
MMSEFILILCSSLAMVFAGMAVNEAMIPPDLITYEQQAQDKALCEQEIKRSEQCVPVMMWLPEASQ